MSVDKYLTYRGDLKALLGRGREVLFVTVHPENLPTALYRLDADKYALDADPLPAGGVALVADDESVWVAGSDAKLYKLPAKGGAAKAVGPTFAAPPTALAILAKNRIGVLTGSEVAILDRKGGKQVQTLELPEPGTCLAADPSGQWLAVGTGKGTVAVFESEDKDEFVPSESGALHEGAVTAVLFEPDDLRFFSAGADGKLLSTHARGRLEPEDRGRGNTHTDLVTALIWGPGERFLSGGRDSTVKAWPRTGNARPVTQKDDVARVVGLGVVTVHNKPFLAVGCEDNSFRFFPLDATGRIGELTAKAHGVAAWAKHSLADNDSRRREAALKSLAEFNDTASIELIANQIDRDADHTLRLLGTQLLGASNHPRAAKFLEAKFAHNDEAVRIAALEGLRKHLGEEELRPLDLALNTQRVDVGRLAVQALEKLAAKDDQALGRLAETLNAQKTEVRQAALFSLEKAYEPQSPEADLQGLASRHADLRRLAVVRLFQRKLLGDPKVQAALRRAAEDGDADVRRTAFLVSLFTRDKLPGALRGRDNELNRQLTELEAFEVGGEGEGKKKKAEPAEKPARKKAAEAGPVDLAETDYEPLLQATAGRALDTCLRGARGLAVLGDPRAFGLLLQLSREENTAARVEVCRALAALDDPRSINRLRSMLYDPQAAVRDAAFTALAAVNEADPLLTAESGLSAGFEDVRRRGLQALVSAVRKKPPKAADQPGWQLLVRALNDSFESVRSEAFKAGLNLQVGGGGVQTYRFILQSIHADVRREVLTEAMAQANEPWAWALVLEFFNDHDPKLREEAFQFATKKSKDLDPLSTALVSQYPDVRKLAVDGLIKKHTAAAQALLVRALADADKGVRQKALDALVGADARTALVSALESEHADIRVQAARALARHGDAASLAPLLALATAPEPEQRERVADWAALVESALTGLGELADPSALPRVVPLLQSPHANIRKAAAQALVWCSRPNNLEALRQALQHSDPQVKYRAALGLAYAGDPLAAAVVFSDQAGQALTPDSRLIAALTLGPGGADQLGVYLDADDEKVRNQALILLMLLELQDPQPTPARLLAALSSRMPRVRLTAARALEVAADPKALREFVVGQINERGEEQAWKIAPEVVDDLAVLIAHGPPQTKARAALLLRHLGEKEQAAWDQGWAAHSERYANEIAELRRQASARPAVERQFGPEQLKQLAFGSYVGLVREQGGGRVPAAQVARVRQTALNRIVALAREDKQFAGSARPVFVQALGDPNQAVRMQAFEQLKALGMDSAALGAAALEAGQTDLGVKGLEILTAGASASQAQKVLEGVMLGRTDNLAVEAAKLLIERRGTAAVGGKALEAASEAMRQQAVDWLTADYEKDAASAKALRGALTSRYQKVREAVAIALANKKDAAAFPALVKLLTTAPDAAKQRLAINALTTLGDPRTPDALIDRVENDPTGTALTDDLFKAAGNFRRPESVNRLLALAERDPKRRTAALNAVLTVSGHDQDIDDPDEERPTDRRWEKEQHPRHDDVLARLMERCVALNEGRLLARLIPAARWARGKDVDPILAGLAAQPDEKQRHLAVEAIGWRLRKRGGPADPLLKALQHRDAQTQFLAAEGLARAGRADGISILLADVDLMSDLNLRQRAVSALGELADPRAVDLLLKLANEEGHALQEEAAEAIGHMGRTNKAEEIYRLLERFAKGDGGVAANALKGLRWLNTPEAWRLIRQRAAEKRYSYLREVAAELLGYDEDPASRDLALRLIATHDDWDVVENALKSARRLFGGDSLEPDYALLQNELAGENLGDADDESSKSLRRVSEEGDPRRIFEILPKCPEAVREPLATSLMNRATLPLKEAKGAIGSPAVGTVRLAAKVLGRAGPQAKDAGPALAEALTSWRGRWQERRDRLARLNVADDGSLQAATECLEGLAWAAGRLGVAQEALVELAAAPIDDARFRPVRQAAVEALAGAPAAKNVLAALEKLAVEGDPEVRAVAAEAVARHSAARAAALAAQVIADRVSYGRLVRGAGEGATAPLRSAAAQVHYQGVALPHLIARGDVAGLSAVAGNGSLPDATRLGAVEGLALLARPDAEAELVKIGQDTAADEELRKAAWRGLRRSKRLRKKKAEQPQATGTGGVHS
jgi:ParB family chromosome partitioning protein